MIPESFLFKNFPYVHFKFITSLYDVSIISDRKKELNYMSLEALIIFSLLNAGQLAENEKTHLQKNQSESHVYVEKQERNETMNIKLK